jgi:hypothetical protein
MLGEKRWVMLYQIRLLHKKRFQHKIGEAESADFNRVKEKLEALLELSLNHHPVFTGIEGIAPQSDKSISNAFEESMCCSCSTEKEVFIAEYFNYPEFA